MKIKFDDQEVIDVNLIWLRDNCRCDECYNSFTNQRRRSDIILDACVKEYSFRDGYLYVSWNNGHNSKYELQWIRTNHKSDLQIKPILWKANEIQDRLPFIDHIQFLKEECTLKLFLKTLLEQGVAFVNNAICKLCQPNGNITTSRKKNKNDLRGDTVLKMVPPNIEMTKKIIDRIGPIMSTIYGGFWEVENDSNNLNTYRDTAYTNTSLAVHTDNTYFIEPAGYQVFHCIVPANEGGETVLVDGFNAIQILKQKNEKYYECLKSTPIEWQYLSENYSYRTVKPIINMRMNTDEVTQIRYNIYDRSSRVPYTTPDKLDKFYESLKQLRDVIEQKEVKWTIKLKSGNMIFVNNWRVLHGRKSFRGNRKLVGCYLGINTLLHKAKLLKLMV